MEVFQEGSNRFLLQEKASIFFRRLRCWALAVFVGGVGSTVGTPALKTKSFSANFLGPRDPCQRSLEVRVREGPAVECNSVGTPPCYTPQKFALIPRESAIFSGFRRTLRPWTIMQWGSRGGSRVTCNVIYFILFYYDQEKAN